LRLPLLLRAPVKISSHYLATAKLVTILLNPIFAVHFRAKLDHRLPSQAYSPFMSHLWLFRSKLQFCIPKLHSQLACFSYSPLLVPYCCHGWRISVRFDHPISWSYTSSYQAYSPPPD
jgi:hypothetical protein